MLTQLKTVDEVIDGLGGTSATALLTGRKPQHVSNWRHEKRLPKNTLFVLQAHLAERQLVAPVELWGFPMPPPRRKRKKNGSKS